MPYVISENTKVKLEALMQKGEGHEGGHAGVGGVRQVCHVKVTGPKAGTKYPCKATSYNATNSTWTEYDATAYVLEANDLVLETNYRYTAIRYGVNADDAYIFVTDVSWPQPGCHIEYNADGEINVVLDELLGKGLEIDDASSSGGCDKMKAKIGCHLKFDGTDAIDVDNTKMKGKGLKVQSDYPCDKLAVDPGCGLRIDGTDKLALNLQDIVFDGLYGDNDICAIGVNYGCGLTTVGTVDGDQLIVDIDGLAGKGLEVTEDDASDSSADHCEQLEVKAGCGIRVDTNGVNVDATAVAGCGLKDADGSGSGCKIDFDAEAVAGSGLRKTGTCGIEIDPTPTIGPSFSCITAISASGCGISYTTTSFNFLVNPAGVFIGFEVGSSTSGSVNIKAACCDCDESSSSSSSSSSGISMCGWYWNAATGEWIGGDGPEDCECEPPTEPGEYDAQPAGTPCIALDMMAVREEIISPAPQPKLELEL